MSDFRIVRAADHRRMPWKNGGGSTAEIAVSPVGATIDDFDWRVSMASVETSGPFSSFPGIDRTLVVLDRTGVSLSIAGRAPVTLTRASEPFAFPADLTTSCELLDGPVADLNVMTRRSSMMHKVRRLEFEGTITIDVACDIGLIFVMRGDVSVADDVGVAKLGPRDSLLSSSARLSMQCASEGFAELLVIEIAHWAA